MILSNTSHNDIEFIYVVTHTFPLMFLFYWVILCRALFAWSACKWVIIVQIVRFSKWCCRRFKSSGMWHCVVGWIVPDNSKCSNLQDLVSFLECLIQKMKALWPAQNAWNYLPNDTSYPIRLEASDRNWIIQAVTLCSVRCGSELDIYSEARTSFTLDWMWCIQQVKHMMWDVLSITAVFTCSVQQSCVTNFVIINIIILLLLSPNPGINLL
jgi:hypothetical protein